MADSTISSTLYTIKAVKYPGAKTSFEDLAKEAAEEVCGYSGKPALKPQRINDMVAKIKNAPGNDATATTPEDAVGYEWWGTEEVYLPEGPNSICKMVWPIDLGEIGTIEAGKDQELTLNISGVKNADMEQLVDSNGTLVDSGIKVTKITAEGTVNTKISFSSTKKDVNTTGIDEGSDSIKRTLLMKTEDGYVIATVTVNIPQNGGKKVAKRRPPSPGTPAPKPTRTPKKKLPSCKSLEVRNLGLQLQGKPTIPCQE